MLAAQQEEEVQEGKQRLLQHLGHLISDVEADFPDIAAILEGVDDRIQRCAPGRQDILLFVLGGVFQSFELDYELSARFLLQVLVILTASHEEAAIGTLRETAKAASAEILLGGEN